jgi:hypothetical protein
MSNHVDQIVIECRAIKMMLLEKNRKYGDSALEPLGVFAPNLTPAQSIRVRIDDKLKRMRNQGGEDEDVVLDLIGYLILLRIAEREEKLLVADPTPPAEAVEEARKAVQRLASGEAVATPGLLWTAPSRVPDSLRQVINQALASAGYENVRLALEAIVHRDEAEARPARATSKGEQVSCDD